METLIISTQLHENKAFNNGGEAWRPKGGFDFTIDVDADEFLHLEDHIVLDVINTILAQQSNDLERFTYIAHELQIVKPCKLSVDFTEMAIIARNKREGLTHVKTLLHHGNKELKRFIFKNDSNQYLFSIDGDVYNDYNEAVTDAIEDMKQEYENSTKPKDIDHERQTFSAAQS